MGTLDDMGTGQASQLNGATPNGRKEAPANSVYDGAARTPRKRTPRTKMAVEPELPRNPWFVHHWREIALIGTILTSVGTFLHESGWLTVPAKESAVKDLETKITDMRKQQVESDERLVKNVDSVATEVREHRTAIGEIGKTLGRMEGKLDTLRPGATAGPQRR